MRLIDADKLIEFIGLGSLRPPTQVFFSEADVCEMIEQAPTVKAWTEAEHNADAFHAYVEGKKSARRHGRWVRSGEPPMYVVECSNCGQKYFNHALQPLARYCSMCGARMDGGDENEAD